MPLSAKEALLRKFYDDPEVYDEVMTYFMAHLDQLALQKVYNKEDTQGIADAKVVLENAFRQLDELFIPKDKIKKTKNESR